MRLTSVEEDDKKEGCQEEGNGGRTQGMGKSTEDKVDIAANQRVEPDRSDTVVSGTLVAYSSGSSDTEDEG